MRVHKANTKSADTSEMTEAMETLTDRMNGMRAPQIVVNVPKAEPPTVNVTVPEQKPLPPPAVTKLTGHIIDSDGRKKTFYLEIHKA